VKVRTDEHVSPEIVRAIRDMALSPGWELTSVLDFDRGTDDVHWITRFARDGGDAIVSADTDFLKVPQQVMAVFNTGLRVVHLPPKWSNAQVHLQAAHLLLWWRRIEARIAAMPARQCVRPPWNIQESGDLIEVPIDFQGARRKARQAARRDGG
jgi:hypothetical protein